MHFGKITSAPGFPGPLADDGSRTRPPLGAFGVPLTQRGVDDLYRLPERIVIFQRDLERASPSREEIAQEVRTTVLHEIAHHFGMDEDQLEDLGYE